MDTTKLIQTESGLDEFQVRLISIEGVGLLTDRDDNSYLILDSLDYWYDLIQERYPAKTKCSCTNDWFKVSFHYEYLKNSTAIRNVQISTVCTSCGKFSKRMTIDIDYEPTDELIENPITYCKTPKIKYKYKELRGLWLSDDLNTVLTYLIKEQGLTANYFYFNYPDKVSVFHPLTLEQALRMGNQFKAVCFTRDPIENAVRFEDETGVLIDNNMWRNKEIIYLSKINGYKDTQYFIKFCNQYIDNGDVKDKSKGFEQITKSFESWLSKTFIKSRGRNCFDGEESYQIYAKSR